ncbi:MAG TPA: hydrogenase iron-sulfur subunit [Myxococcales bacterium]
MERVGVFLCTGCGIGESLSAAALEKVAREAGAAQVETSPRLCAFGSVASICTALDTGTVDAAVIAGCSPRHKRQVFQFGAGVPVQRVALREQATWTHAGGDENTQALAEDLLRMSVVRAQKSSAAKRAVETVEQTVLVVGGGLTGLSAAQAAAGMGHPVVLLEKSAALGGHLAGIDEVVPHAPPYDRAGQNPIHDLVRAVQADGRIQALTDARILRIAGEPGRFEVEVELPSGKRTLTAGAIVQATGARPYPKDRLGHLGAGISPDVITSAELEPMLSARALRRPSDGRLPERVVFVQCAGSRDKDHLEYCSSECCATSLRQVLAIHRHWPHVECAVLYRDLRMPGALEHFYRAAQEQSRVMLARGTVSGVSRGGHGRLQVSLRDSLLGEDVNVEADLVVLATGMIPNSADGEAIRQLRDAKKRIERSESETQRTAAEAQAAALARHQGTEILNLGYRQGPDLPVLAYGFPDSHYICFPYESRRTGIYAAGALRAPMDAAEAVDDGFGAAMKAVQVISALGRGETVHPRSGDIAPAEFFLQRCTQCKRCTEECPFGTLDEDAKGTPQYNALRCRHCGICLGACPERIISFPDYSVDAVAGMIKSIEIPDESEEKPRILALLCENDAYPALDDAAARRASWNPWVRAIPVRCLGAVNMVWINEALSRGIDGVILIGCKRGENAQCHYVKGSELAHKRLENVQETLDRLSLESERVQVVELARDELSRIPALFDEFARRLVELGPNPLKGF